MKLHACTYHCQVSWGEVGIWVACENSCFSLLLATVDILQGGTSATQRQKFHTDDIKSVRNPDISADWTMKSLQGCQNVLKYM